MGNPYFDFKQFRIYHERCAMKVGTDGVLLGAWPSIDDKCDRVLDVGTGSGLIALMVAQRSPAAEITAIDIDNDCVEQAKTNVCISPFSERINVLCGDVRRFKQSADFSHLFNHIFCNPPFYQEDTKPQDMKRALARNAHSLPYSELVCSVSSLLEDGGFFHVVLPSVSEGLMRYLCGMSSLQLIRICRVKTVGSKMPKRVLMTFCKMDASTCCLEEELVLMKDGNRSKEYAELTRDFYL